DAARRKKARVPKKITFKTKPEIALEQIRKAYAAGVPRGAVLIDASYGSNSALRTGISALGLKYVAAIIPTVKVRRVSDRGASDERLSAKELALSVIFSTSTEQISPDSAGPFIVSILLALLFSLLRRTLTNSSESRAFTHAAPTGFTRDSERG